jgi:pyruvate dehydrogenase E1 component beta subunit
VPSGILTRWSFSSPKQATGPSGKRSRKRKSQIVQEGDDLTFISYGAMMRPTLEAATELKEKEGIKAEVIDLLTLSPLDDELFTQSIRKTGRAVVVHEAVRSFGPGAEIVARTMEKVFYYLEAPIARVTGYDIPIPLFSREKDYFPGKERILRAARKVLSS